MTDTARTITNEVRRPTEEELAAYRRDGFVVARALVPGDVLDVAERGMERFYARNWDGVIPGRTRYDEEWVPEMGEVLRKNDYAAFRAHDLWTLIRWPGIGAYAAELAGSSGIRLWHDQLLYKPSGGPAVVGWHTDRQYWRSCSSAEMLTCWVPFHDCGRAAGSITFVRGSHTWTDSSGLDFFVTDLSAQEAQLRSGGQVVDKVTPELRRGDVTFHHCRTVHGSGPNSSGVPRRSLAVHLQPLENRHVHGVDDAGRPAYHRNDDLVRSGAGGPDYGDPRICPQLWPELS